MKASHKQLEQYLSTNVRKYLNESGMENNGTWATDAEIMAAASLLRTDIVVYAQHGLSFGWLSYPASYTLSKKTDDAFFHYEPFKRSLRRRFVKYIRLMSNSINKKIM
jgi:hypothetical protein